MSFKITISDASQVFEKCIESVACKIDTPNDANARSTDIDNLIDIVGRIGTDEPTIELFLWSLLPANDPKSYRNVKIEYIGAQGQILRRINFPNAFVVDYSESYSNYEGEGSFCIMIKQKKDKNASIKVEGDMMDLDN